MLNKGLDPFVMISNPKPICDDPECLRDRAAMFLSQTSESLSRNSQGSHQSDSINPPNYQDPTFIDTHQNEAQRIQNIERVMELAVSFSKQDIQIVFYELPLADIYRNSSYVQDVREIIKRNIKTFNMNPIITFDISEKNLTWPDGHHLDERSSIIVGRNLEQKVRNLINLKK